MSVSEQVRRSAGGLASEQTLSGWGRTSWSRCAVLRPGSVEEVGDSLLESARSGRSIIARGAGRSYGDAAQNDGGDVLDMRSLNRVVSIGSQRMRVRAQAGVTVGELMARLAAHGLGLPVVPGTRHVTVAGAIASDVHGKNHHRDGGFARHVTSLTLCTPTGELLDLDPESEGDLFYGTFGGMGLTGVVVEATLQAEPLERPWVAVDLTRTSGLEETLELMGGDEPHRYSVAWLDLLAKGSGMGRAMLSRADPLPAGAPIPHLGGSRAARRSYPGALCRSPALEVPHRFPAGLLRPESVRAFNELRWRSAPREDHARPLGLVPYFFPLDVLGSWNRLYGEGGLVQYQFVIPAGQESSLERCFALIGERNLPVYLAVFKRFGGAFGGPLSFPLEGWTLAIDLPAQAPGLQSGLDALDEIVAECGGRVYLSKDSRLRPGMLERMYPRLGEFNEQRARVDPEGLLRSDLAARIGLVGSRA